MVGGQEDCMNALSVHQPWASHIASGRKSIEMRSWLPPHRMIGRDILIVSSKTIDERFQHLAIDGAPLGQSLCVATLIDAFKYSESFGPMSMWDGPWDGFAWVFLNVRMVKPFKVRGWPRFFEVHDDLIKFA
jgi:hypothetical protein